MSLPPPAPDTIALVTGASSGIGEQYARQLGGQEGAVAIPADLAVPEDRDRLVARLEERGARVEVLVNNAGYGIYESFVESGSSERVARDALEAADRGRISVIPGGLQVKAAFTPNRKLPRWLVLRVSKRMMARR